MESNNKLSVSIKLDKLLGSPPPAPESSSSVTNKLSEHDFTSTSLFLPKNDLNKSNSAKRVITWPNEDGKSMSETDDEVYLVSISQDLRANYFGRDAATQIEESHILDLKRTEQKVTVMATDIVIWKRDLMLATEGIIARYEDEVNRRAAEIADRVEMKVAEMELMHKERIETLRRSYRSQLSDALARAWNSAQNGGKPVKPTRNPDDLVKIMRLEQITTQLESNNQVLNSRLEDANAIIDDLRKKIESAEETLAKEKKRALEFETLRESESVGLSRKSRRKSPSKSVSAETKHGKRKTSSRKKKSEDVMDLEIKVADGSPGDDSAEPTSSQILLPPSPEQDRDSRITEEESYDCMSPPDVAIITTQKPEAGDTEELEVLRKEKAALKAKLTWLDEKLKSVSENNSLVTETLNELHSRYKEQGKSLDTKEKQVAELRLLINQERSERLQEIALIKDEAETRRRTEVDSLQKELKDILNDRTRLSQDDVLKLMTGKSDMEKQLKRTKLEKRKETQVLLHQQMILKNEVSRLRQEVRNIDKMWIKKFEAINHSYHAIREEYHLREALRRQFRATQKVDLVRNGSSTMSKSVIQNNSLPNGLSINPYGVIAVSSVDQQFLENSTTSNELNKRKNGLSNGHLQPESDYSDEEFHAEYSYLSLIREVAESSEASNPQQLLPGPNPSAIQPEKLTSGAPNQMIMSSNDDSSGDPLLVSLAESENAIG